MNQAEGSQFFRRGLVSRARQVRDLQLEADGKALLEGAATFRLRSGDWALLTGPEGAGKTNARTPLLRSRSEGGRRSV